MSNGMRIETEHVAGISDGRNPQQSINGGQAEVAPAPYPGSILPKQISITPLNHGFHVVVGCQVFAVETIDALLHRLSVYLKDPSETERRWMSGEWKW